MRPTVVALLACVAFGACDEPPSEVESPGKPVLLVSVESRDLEVRIEATGELLAKHHAEVAAQVGGESTEILADEGAAVEEGMVVLEIDPERRQLELDRTRARVEEARAALTEQRREFERRTKLAEQHIASRAQLDQAETAQQTARSRLHAAQAELGVAERELADASVTASFAGLIARRMVSRGEFVATGQPLFELVSLDPIEVEFHLPEADASRVRPGMPVEVTVAPYPDDVFDAVVSMVAPTIDPRTRTLRVKALLGNADGRLLPGLFARVDLGVALRPGALLVPEEAVLQRADGQVVFRLVDGNRVERKVVEIGVIRGGYVELLSGASAGDRLVARGHADLIDGSVVVARNADGTLAVSSGPLDGQDEGGP